MTIVGHARFDRLNSLAGLFAVALFVALGVAWWRDRAQRYETPRWSAARFEALTAGDEPAPQAPDDVERDRPWAPLGDELAREAAARTGELWVVAVNLDCAHCQQHLRALSRRTAGRSRPPRLAVLLVDSPGRPERFDLGVPLAGGTWWDRDQVWRQSWGRRVYGETFRFDTGGRLLSSTPAGVVPDSSGSRM